MSQTNFRKSSKTILEQISTKSINVNKLAEQLPTLFNMSPNYDELSLFLNEIKTLFPNFGKEIKTDSINYLVSKTPIQYLGYLKNYLKINLSVYKEFNIKILNKIVLNQDYQSLLSSEDKITTLRNGSMKIQLLYPILSQFKRKLSTEQAFRLIGFITFETSSEKTIFMQLVKLIAEDVSKIKWQFVLNFLQPSIQTRGNYGTLISLIKNNHVQIAQSFTKILKQGRDIEIYLQAILSDSMAPNLMKVLTVITKNIFSKSNKNINIVYMNSIFKTILLPNLESSKFYKDIEQVVKSTFIKLNQPFYPIKQKDIIPKSLSKYYPQQHFNMLIEIVNFWSSPSEKQNIILKLQKLAPLQKPNKKRQDQNFLSKTANSIFTKTNSQFVSQLNTSQQYKPLKSTNIPQIVSSKLPPRKSSFGSHEIIMFDCDQFIGIPNVGNTCYINSFIQNLLFCKQFMSVIMKSNLEKQKIFNILKKIFIQLRDKNSSNLKELLIDFKKQLPTMFSIDDAQQDSMQFGSGLINKMMQIQELQTSIKQIFITQTNMVTKCPDGHISSSMQQLNSELMLAFEHPTLISKLKGNPQITTLKLNQLLNSYFADTLIQGQFKCTKCNKKFKSCSREPQLIALPHTLILILNRFMFDIDLMKKRKILDVVELQDYIHFGNINTHSKIQTKYKLNSFVVHLGNQAESGHYQVYVKHPSQQQCWVIFDDDNSVMQMSCPNVKDLCKNLAPQQSPYILFYTRM